MSENKVLMMAEQYGEDLDRKIIQDGKKIAQFIKNPTDEYKENALSLAKLFDSGHCTIREIDDIVSQDMIKAMNVDDDHSGYSWGVVCWAALNIYLGYAIKCGFLNSDEL